MAGMICPWWMGYVLVSPLRRFLEPPSRVVSPYVVPGMVVLEPGCGMGFFTLEVARAVGPDGRVVAVDVQERMLAGLRRRAGRAGLLDRIEIRQPGPERLGVEDLAGSVDLVLAIHVVHELPSAAAFFAEIGGALKPGGLVLLLEPRGHVSAAQFAATLQAAERTGLRVVAHPTLGRGRGAVLRASHPESAAAD
jgi:ubiquinone/menaquinone biosynthesis C-methylase UbiE